MNFLPGWRAPSKLGGLNNIALVLSATSLIATLTVPSGVRAGDLLVFLDRVSTTGLPTSVVPSGFTTAVTSNDATNVRMITSYKIANGTEGGTNITGMTPGDFEDGKALLVFRGNKPIRTASLLDAAGEVTNGNPASQVVNASGGAAPLIVIAGYASNTAVNPRTFTPTKDGEVNPDTLLYLAYKIYNSGPADVTVDIDDEGNGNGLQSFYIACA